MSAADFQKRIADLTFSAQEHLKALQKEQDDSEEDHQAWEEEGTGLEGEDLENHIADEPEIISNDKKIAHIETAIGYLEAAVDELDGALDQ